MFKIQTRDNISPVGLNLLDPKKYQAGMEISDPDALLLRSCKIREAEIGVAVKAVGRAGVGVNNIPVDACTGRGIVVFNTPGANANSVKELVIAGLLLSARRIYQGMNWVETQIGDGNLARNVEKEKSLFAGTEIGGKKLGVVGLGAIGVLVANAAAELEMEVYGYDPFISVEAAWGLSSRVRRCETLNQVVETCDYISLHVPLSPDTERIIGPDSLRRAKRGLRVLNFSRGELVDTSAMERALAAKTVSNYVTDFPAAELLGLDGVLSIPHLGASTAEAEENCAMMAVRQLRNFLEQGSIVNSVNFPACSLELTGGIRLVLANRNIPNMLSQILAVLAKENLNVEDMMNRHRDGIAYNIIDLSASRVGDGVLAQLAGIDGVLMVRQIHPPTDS